MCIYIDACRHIDLCSANVITPTHRGTNQQGGNTTSPQGGGNISSTIENQRF